ncbi:MAG: carboxypeptidase regulatory-like domain-containing protein, partial [Phycisphaerales bacterium]
MQKRSILVLWTSFSMIFLASSAQAQSSKNQETKQIKCTGKVVDEQNRPIADVNVALHEMIYNETASSYDTKLTGQVSTRTDGAFSFTRHIDTGVYRYGYLIAEKEGWALGWANWRMQDGDTELEIKLSPPDTLAGVVVDSNNEPISQAEVSFYMLLIREGEERKYLSSGIAPKLFMVQTDGEGKFIFKNLPAKATADFLIKKTGHATINTWKASDSLTYSVGQKNIRVILPEEAKIEGVVLENETGKPVGGIKLVVKDDRNRSAQEPFPSKEDGTF